MSHNAELSRIFQEMAAVLELLGANRFRVNAHQHVARLLKDMVQDIATEAESVKSLTAIDGIGEASAKKIIEYLEHGVVEEHQELLEQIPSGLLKLLELPGLGPKTVKLLWEEADVTDLPSLKKAISAEKLEDLPRMGAKTITNLKDAIAFAAKSGKRIRLGKAMSLAEPILEHLRMVKGVKRIESAGSLRRGRETIGDIDLLASTSQPEALSTAFQSLEDVEKVLAAGSTKSSIRLKSGIQIDLRIIDVKSFGAAQMYFTGSKQHNVAMRERAIKRGLRLNEYGLFPDDDVDEPPQKRGIKPKASKTEEDIFKALDLPWIPPALREDRGELAVEIPTLIELEDIACDLHTHTVASDGKMTIEESAVAAKRRGYHTVAITDHSKASAQANGLDEKRLRKHIQEIRKINDQIKGITLLAGAEVDILSDGSLDYDDDMLAELDIVIASPHVALKQTPEKATQRLLAAITHPLVHILAHPTGRIINRREGLKPDMPALIEAAVEHNTALEINANELRLDLRDTHVRAAVEAGALITINTDAHQTDQFDQMRYGVLTGQRGWLTPESCLNTWSKRKLMNWLAKKQSA